MAQLNMHSKSIDYAKGLAILLVLLGHIRSPLGVPIFSFHVPLFFFLAGIFIKTNYSSVAYLKKGLERLVVPFLIFGVIGLLATDIKNVLLHRPIETFAESLAGLLFWMDTLHLQHYGFALWFLPALFWGRSIAFLLVKYVHWNLGVLIGGAMVAAWAVKFFVVLPFGIDKGLVALPWILMGYGFFQYQERWEGAGLKTLIAVICALILLVFFGAMQRLDLATRNIGTPFLTFPYTLLVSLLLIWVVQQQNISKLPFGSGLEKVLARFGRDSLLVLVLHVYTNNISDILVNLFLGPEYWPVTFIISAMMVYLSILLRRRFAGWMIFRYL